MSPETELLRQIHPSWIVSGRVSSQAFKPTPKDEKRLSVDNGDMFNPEESYRHFTEKLSHLSVGVMSVTKLDCSNLDLAVLPDPEPYPEHTLIDFSKLGTNQIEKKAKKLKARAIGNNWRYKPFGCDADGIDQ